MEERLELRQDMLAKKALLWNGKRKMGSIQIHENFVAHIIKLELPTPKVCTVDQTTNFKDAGLTRQQSAVYLSGAAHCTYVIQPVEVKN